MAPEETTLRRARPGRRPAVLGVSLLLMVLTLLLGGSVAVLAYLGGLEHEGRVRDEGDPIARPDPETGYAPTPSGSTLRTDSLTALTYTVLNDSRGARSERVRDGDEPAAALLVGGSYVWGHGLDYADTFASSLERTLGARVANFAFGGFGTVQSLQMMERNLDLAPELVIYGFMQDHARRNLAPCAPSYGRECVSWSRVCFEGDGSPYIARPAIAHNELLVRSRSGDEPLPLGERLILGTRRLTHRWWPPGCRAPDDPERRRIALRFLLSRMAAAAHTAGASLLVLHLPWFGDEPDPPPEALLTTLPVGIHFLDLFPAVVRTQRESPDSLVIEGDGHPNALANDLVAAEVAAFLRRQGIGATPARGSSS